MKAVLRNIKNIQGWRSSRRLLVLAVDDYGNVRLASKQAAARIQGSGVRLHSRFDAFDAMESKQDLAMLYDVLMSVKDSKQRFVVFSPFVLTHNIDFDRMREENWTRYVSETLPSTFSRLECEDGSNYEGAWELWREGVREGLMAPEFHGREHINLKVFNEKLFRRDRELLAMLQNSSFLTLSNTGYRTIKPTAAFAFWDRDETLGFSDVLRSGLEAFRMIFGFDASVFTPPAHCYPLWLEAGLKQLNILGLDKPFVSREHVGDGRFTYVVRCMKYSRSLGISNIVRNVVFEPTHDRGIDWVAYALKEIESAFRWRKPAVISSHRVNFSGAISTDNRRVGLAALRQLLHKVVMRWPDVEFVSVRELTSMISDKRYS